MAARSRASGQTISPPCRCAHSWRGTSKHRPLERIDDVLYGCANQAGEDNRNVARMALPLAGLPDTVPGVTINRLCASGRNAAATGTGDPRRRDGLRNCRRG